MFLFHSEKRLRLFLNRDKLSLDGCCMLTWKYTNQTNFNNFFGEYWIWPAKTKQTIASVIGSVLSGIKTSSKIIYYERLIVPIGIPTGLFVAFLHRSTIASNVCWMTACSDGIGPLITSGFGSNSYISRWEVMITIIYQKTVFSL